MTEIMKTLKESSNLYKKISEKAKLLTQLNVLRMGEGVIELDKNIIFETIYSSGATITIAKYPKMGARVPNHNHEGIVEYLICNKGSFSINFANNFRVLKIRDCVSIPEGMVHTTTALQDNSELIAVCVPVEPLYAVSMTTIK
jgi:hypothetical protein